MGSNGIAGISIKNRQAGTITQALIKFENIFNYNASANTLILDYEASFELENAMRKKRITYQIIPPHNHRANLAEQAIKIFKNHYKVGLSTLHPDFLMTEWDCLLPQAFLTLNLLQHSNVNPQLSVHAYPFEQFNFNKTPYAPPASNTY